MPTSAIGRGKSAEYKLTHIGLIMKLFISPNNIKTDSKGLSIQDFHTQASLVAVTVSIMYVIFFDPLILLSYLLLELVYKEGVGIQPLLQPENKIFSILF